MANIMSLKERKNHVSRNGFDLSHTNYFTAKVGELLPVYFHDCVPGSKHKVPVKMFSRTIPLNSAAYTRVKEYCDFFFVPYRLLWRYADTFFIQGNDSYVAESPAFDSPVARKFPTIKYSDLKKIIRDIKKSTIDDNSDTDYNIHGINRADCIAKLAEYLDYGKFNSDDYIDDSDNVIDITGADVDINIMSFLAYQKIYFDYYRFGQWERNVPQSYNIDYVDTQTADSETGGLDSLLTYAITHSESPFELRYANWHKDMFMGLLPTPQYGDTANASIFGNGLIDLDLRNELGAPSTLQVSSNLYPHPVSGRGAIGIKNSSGNSTSILQSINLSSSSRIGNLSILALRQAESLQKWKEISFSGNEDYRTQIKKHFNVDPGPLRSKLCEFIDGFSNDIQIDSVVNQNLSTSDDDTDIKGIGISSGKNYFEYEAKEHGIIMGIYHAQPILDYEAIGINPLHLKILATDFIIPEFDKIGMQSVPGAWLFADTRRFFPSGSDFLSASLGYAPRYVEYKTAVNKVRGGFLRTFKNWVATYSAEMLQRMFSVNQANFGRPFSYVTFKVPPYILDSILSVKSDAYEDTRSDHLICSISFDDRAVEPIDRDGLPY